MCLSVQGTTWRRPRQQWARRETHEGESKAPEPRGGRDGAAARPDCVRRTPAGPEAREPGSRAGAGTRRRQIPGSAERREPEASRGHGGERAKEGAGSPAAGQSSCSRRPSARQVTASHLGCRSLQHMLPSLPGPVQGLPCDVTQSQSTPGGRWRATS